MCKDAKVKTSPLLGFSGGYCLSCLSTFILQILDDARFESNEAALCSTNILAKFNVEHLCRNSLINFLCEGNALR